MHNARHWPVPTEDKLPGTNAKLYDTQENAYLDLTSGRLDGMLADKYVQYEWLKSKDGSAYEFKGDPVVESDKIGIAVRKGDPLRERLNKAWRKSRPMAPARRSTTSTSPAYR